MGNPIVRFLRRRARAAEEVVARAQGVVDILKFSRADVSAAEGILAEARKLGHAGDHRGSAEAGRRAAALASRLEDRYLAYRRARQAAASALARLRRFSLPATQLEAAFADARGRAGTTVLEDGVAIPDYVEARAILERATAPARGTIHQFDAAGAAILAAELAVDSLREVQDDIDVRRFQEMLLRPAEAAFERATEALAMLRPGDAVAAAKAAEGMALRARADCAEARNARVATERLLAELRGEGAITLAADRLLEAAATLLAEAKVLEAKEMIVHSQREATRLAEEFRLARAAIAEAKSRMVSGHVGEDAVRSLREAERAVHEGSYRRAAELVRDTSSAMVRHASTRAALAAELRETRAEVERLKAAREQDAGDVEEVLARAEKEFVLGNGDACSEDLRVVKLLIGPKVPKASAPPVAIASIAPQGASK